MNDSRRRMRVRIPRRRAASNARHTTTQFARPGRRLADRLSRKWLFVTAQAIMTCASIGLATVSYAEGPVPLVYVCLLLVGIGRAFSAPARWALIPQIVAPEALGNAVTWNSSGWQV